MLDNKLDNIVKYAREMIAKHNLNGWYFEWDRSKRRYGSCRYLHQKITISYALATLNPIEETYNVILHEIAHALTKGHHHDHIWKATARAIGCTGDRCYDSKSVVQPKPNYVLVCPNCKNETPRYRKTRHTLACATCCNRFNFGKFDIRFKLALKYA